MHVQLMNQLNNNDSISILKYFRLNINLIVILIYYLVGLIAIILLL